MQQTLSFSLKVGALKTMINSSRKIYTFSKNTSFNEKLRRIGIHGIVVLSIPVGTFCLGCWQVSRRKWKLQLVEELGNKTKLPAVPFPENVASISSLEYRKVEIHGEFDHSREVYIGPRPQLIGGDIKEVAGGLISSGVSGYNVITPFTLSDKGLTILVNRGWVPRKSLNPSQRMKGQITGPVSLTGIVRNEEKRAPFMPQNLPNTNIFTYRDVTKMAQMVDCAPLYVEAVETFEGGPVGGQTRVTLRNEHMSYILTWYSLSLITSFLWYRRFILRKPLM